MEQESEFYIGWQASTPPSFARRVKGFILGLGLLMPFLAITMVYFQKGFSSGTFEYGKSTELIGVFTQAPIPFLEMENGQNVAGKAVLQKILLVGPGKSGYRANPQDLLNGARVKVSGFLIYNDGKTALQVESMKRAVEQDGKDNVRTALNSTASIKDMNAPMFTLRGEITDPKCLLGVMNPGQGKPHRDCAIRCISGGLPPVLKVANEQGDTEYYLLVGPDGEAINEQILDYVGDGVELCGRMQAQADWRVLYVDLNTLHRIQKASLHPGPMCQ